MDRRLLTAAAGLGISLLLSAALWLYFDTLALFLFVPFVPFFLFRRGKGRTEPSARTCPVCDFSTTDEDFEYCPRDGHRLR